MFCRVFPGSRNLLHSHLVDAGFSYTGTLGGDFMLETIKFDEIVADKDDLFVQSKLLEGKYKFDMGEVSKEEWPMFSFWKTASKLEMVNMEGVANTV